MTIRPGEEWGVPCEVAPGWPRVTTDAAVADRAPGPLVVAGGDLFWNLGGRGGPTAMQFPIDLLFVEIGEQTYRAAAHVVLRGVAWSGPTIIAMNASHLGPWYLGPKAHPNDGLVDVTVGQLGWAQRWQARKRAATGAHLPHPDLRYRRVEVFDVALAVRRQLWIDGIRCGSVRAGSAIRISVQADAAEVVLDASGATSSPR